MEKRGLLSLWVPPQTELSYHPLKSCLGRGCRKQQRVHSIHKPAPRGWFQPPMLPPFSHSRLSAWWVNSFTHSQIFIVHLLNVRPSTREGNSAEVDSGSSCFF